MYVLLISNDISVGDTEMYFFPLFVTFEQHCNFPKMKLFDYIVSTDFDKNFGSEFEMYVK